MLQNGDNLIPIENGTDRLPSIFVYKYENCE